MAFALFASPVYAAEFRPTAQESIVAPDAKFELVWGDGDFTEGPAAAEDGSIYFSDIGDRILRYDPRSRETTVHRQPSGKANGLAFDKSNRLIACEGANGGGRRLSITTADGRVAPLADRYQGKRFNSPNDVCIDAAGRVYFSDPRYVGEEPRELDFCGVFVVDPQGEVRLATRSLKMPNGLIASRDGSTLYVAEHEPADDGDRHLVAFTIRPDGALSDQRVLFDFGRGFRGIDGMSIDAEGNIYAAAGKGEHSGIYVFDGAGKHLALIPLPGAPTNCTFGRGDESNVLYVTGAVNGDEAGGRYGLFRIELLKRGG